jgi:Mg/Co/Ni transporter MgtE
MHELTVEELKERIIAQMDPDTLIEVLGISVEDLVEALSDHIEENYERLIHELPEDEFGED